jgi:hypothetical protein
MAAECQDIEPSDIRQLGNWDPTMQEKAYSGKIPIRAMKGVGGYNAWGGVYFTE